MQSISNIKQQIHDYWNKQSCGTSIATSQKFSRVYFEEIETDRYEKEPEIFSFAQFTRAHGQKVLEVGIGAGTDFIQWVRAGAKAYGIDLTEEAITNVEHRLAVYGLEAQEVQVADCESLPYTDNMFDLVYSWGVIHHTPDMPKALREIVRVIKPGGTGKIMIYNRHSAKALSLWLRFCLIQGRPWCSLTWVLYHYMESIGTKGYTFSEVKQLFADLPVINIHVQSQLTYYDRHHIDQRFGTRLLRIVARLGSFVLGWRQPGWFIRIEFKKV